MHRDMEISKYQQLLKKCNGDRCIIHCYSKICDQDATDWEHYHFADIESVRFHTAYIQTIGSPTINELEDDEELYRLEKIELINLATKTRLPDSDSE